MPPSRNARRLAGAAAVASVPLLISSQALASAVHAAALLLAVPAVVVLGAAVRGRAPRRAVLATGALAGSTVLWATVALAGAWALEAGYLFLSAVGWLALAPLLRDARGGSSCSRFSRVFAASDTVVTALEGRLPFVVFAVLGGPKIPLQLAWQVGLGVLLLRGGGPVFDGRGSGSAAA